MSVAIWAQATVLPSKWRRDVSPDGPRCSRSFGTHPCKLAGWLGFSWHAYHHFEALSAASRHTSLVLTDRQRRQVTHLDIAFNCSRHVTCATCEQIITEILDNQTVLRYKLVMMNVRRLMQHQHSWSNTWFLNMLMPTQHNFLLATFPQDVVF